MAPAGFPAGAGFMLGLASYLRFNQVVVREMVYVSVELSCAVTTTF